jgi:gamma-glutamyltranspeptidase/glutathione hydrolase
MVHEKYGRLPRATVLQAAIDLAEGGFVIYPHLAAAIASRKDVLKASPAALPIFFRNGDPAQPLRLGDQLVQQDLAKVLRQVAAEGKNGFYEGWVGAALIAEQRRTKGIITHDDLLAYRPRFVAPLVATFGPYEIHAMPSPSSGGAHIIEMLNIMEGFDLRGEPYAPESIHRTASAMQIAYRDRARYLGDMDFVRVPQQGLTSQSYADAWRAAIPDAKALHLPADGPIDAFQYESPETTHFTIADREGNVVASTQTINGWFGSGVVVSGTGLVMNNEMDDFSVKPGVPNKFGVIGGPENSIQPRKRPLSSMSPTIVQREGKPVMALGSPSGPQIINCVMLTIMNYLSASASLWDAVSALRYHQQWRPDQLLVEAPGFPDSLTHTLKAMGHPVVLGEIGCKVQAIAYEAQGIRGVSDPRGEGLVAGEGKIPAPETQAEAEGVSRD